jgi:hypothetical protein
MPIAILLDTSISMHNPLGIVDDGKSPSSESPKQTLTRVDVAKQIIKRLIEHISKHDKFEYLAFVN